MKHYEINEQGLYTFSTILELGKPCEVIKPKDVSLDHKYRELVIVLASLLDQGWVATFISESKMNTIIGDSLIINNRINLFNVKNEVTHVIISNDGLMIKGNAGVFTAFLPDITTIHLSAVASINSTMGTLSVGTISFSRIDEDSFKLEIVTENPSILDDVVDIEYDKDTLPVDALALAVDAHLIANEYQLTKLLWDKGLRYKGSEEHIVTGYHEYPAIVTVHEEGFSMESVKMIDRKAKELEDESHGVSKEVFRERGNRTE